MVPSSILRSSKYRSIKWTSSKSLVTIKFKSFNKYCKPGTAQIGPVLKAQNIRTAISFDVLEEYA